MTTTSPTALAETPTKRVAAPQLVEVWFLTLVLTAIAAVGWTAIASRFEPVLATPWPWWFFLALFAVGKHLRIDIAAVGSQRMSLVMTDAALVMALLLAEPNAIPLAISAAALSVAAVKRPPIVKVTFNLAQELAGAFFGLAAFHVIRDDNMVSARTGLAALVGGVVVGVFSHQAVAIVTRLAGGQGQQAPIRSLAISSVGSLGNGVVALQIVYLGSISPALAVVPLLLVAVLLAGYRSLSAQQQTTDRTELLYRATAALHEQPNMDEALLDVLNDVRTALRAERAQIVLTASEGAATCTSLLDSHTPMTAASSAEEFAAQQLARELPGAVLMRSGAPAATSGAASVFATGEAIFAPVVRGGEPAGVVVVSGRLGAADPLQQSDVDLVDVLAKQIGLALEKGFLEKSIRQLVELEQQLTRQAYFDAVTGLANRNFLNDELARLLGTSDGNLNALLVIDLDDFKTVNDSLGHVAGDQLLAVVAQRLLDTVDHDGVVTRIGGDEFAIVLRSLPTVRSATDLASRIIEQVSHHVMIDGREVGVGASVGIRLTTGAPDQATELLRDADLALYNAKAQGKGQSAVFEPSMHEQAQERLTLNTALANAVDRDEFALVYQPIIDLHTRRLAGVEALVRWRHPERGEIGPAQFLHLTEDSGLIVLLGRNILRQALTAMAGWQKFIDDREFHISVNVSARQLREHGFADSVLDLLRQFNIPTHRLVLEITESMLIDDLERTKQVLEVLTAVGIRFSLDDFGTGYSSLSQMQQLPFHQLKIDQSFVRRLGTGNDARVVVRAILQLAEAMGMEAIAEGIENPEHLRELLALNCPMGQGWLFSKAVTSETIAARLLREHAEALTAYPAEPTATALLSS